MKKIFIFVIVILLALVGKVSAETVELEGLNNPTFMTVDSKNIYVVDGIKIKIYSLKDYSKVGEFGKAGTGPGEFRQNPVVARASMQITTSGNHILVNNMDRLFLFTKDGKYVKEQKLANMRTSFFRDMGDKYAAVAVKVEGTEVYRGIAICNKSDLKEVKLLAKSKVEGGASSQNPLPSTVEHALIDNCLYVSASDGMGVFKFDSKGNPLGKVDIKDYKFRKVTDADKQNVLDTVKKMIPANLFERVKKMLKFPEHFPAIQRMLSDGKNIIVQTWKNNGKGEREIYIFDKDLKTHKVVYAPFFMEDAVVPYPSDVINGKMYQVVENEDTEEWDLHITKLI